MCDILLIQSFPLEDNLDFLGCDVQAAVSFPGTLINLPTIGVLQAFSARIITMSHTTTISQPYNTLA